GRRRDARPLPALAPEAAALEQLAQVACESLALTLHCRIAPLRRSRERDSRRPGRRAKRSGRSAGRVDAEHVPRGEPDDVELAVEVLAEGRQPFDPARGIERAGDVHDVDRAAGRSAARRQEPHPVRAVVAEEVAPRQLGDRSAAIDEAAGHGAPRAPVVLVDGEREPGRVAAGFGTEAVKALGDRPSEVEAALPRRHVVDLLEAVLPDVADPEVAGGAIEAEAPRVPEALLPDVGIAGGGVPGRRVGIAVDVDAEELSELRGRIARVVHRVAGAAAVAEPDRERAVGSEGEHAAVVVRERLIDAEEETGRLGIGDRRILARAPELDDLGVAVGVGVIDEEAAVRRVAGMEREAEESALAAARDDAREVEERLGSHATALDDP